MLLIFFIFYTLVIGLNDISGEYYQSSGPLNMEVSCTVQNTSNNLKIVANLFKRTSTDKFEFTATGESFSCLLTEENIFNLTFFDNRDKRNHTWFVFPKAPITLSIKPDEGEWYQFYKFK